MTDLRQTTQYAKYMESLGWKVYKIQKPNVKCQIYAKKLPLLGHIAKLQRPQINLDFTIIKEIVRLHKIAALYIENSTPYNPQHTTSLSLAKSAFLPTKTIFIDLKKPEAQLLKEMKPKTRYNIGLAKRRGVIIKQSDDIDTFINLWKFSAHKRLAFSQDKEITALCKSFGKKASLLLAYQSSRFGMHVHSKYAAPLAGVLVARSPDTAFYLYAASTKEGKRQFAPTLLVWEAIRLAKKKGCKIFDFEGFYDERYPKQTKNWRGFSKFKEGFGGKIVEFPKTLAYFSNPLLKFL